MNATVLDLRDMVERDNDKYGFSEAALRKLAFKVTSISPRHLMF
jgi:hypothetical protein